MAREIEIDTFSSKQTIWLHCEYEDKFVIEVEQWIDRDRQQLLTLELNEDNVVSLENALREWNVRRNDHCLYQITPDGAHDGWVSMPETKTECAALLAMTTEDVKRRPGLEGYRFEVRPLPGHKELIEKEFGSKVPLDAM